VFSVTEQQLTKIGVCDTAYPYLLRDLPDAPETLYALGDISLLQTELFTIVGSRRTPMYALKTGKQISEELSHSFTIVTGTADGGDVVAIEGALMGSGKVICVLAGGFSALPQNQLPLLERVAEKGLLLSTHEFETTVRAFSYEYRNKFLSALGANVLVLGAGEKSGALITAKYAKKQGKNIFALPYPPNTEIGKGCNALIKQGAYLTETAEDIFDVLHINVLKALPKIELSETEEMILETVKTLVSGHIIEIAERTGLPTYKLQGALSALEVKGVITHLGGNRYAPV
jgi:DNA processing protein